MAGKPIIISGVLYDKYGRTSSPVTLVGEYYDPSLSIWHEPIIPPEQPGQPPLGIWGPTDPRPSPPIYMPPGWWGNPGGWNPHPEHPIVIPPPPTDPPDNPGAIKPPPEGGGWGYSPEYGWGYFPMKGGKPQPPGAAKK